MHKIRYRNISVYHCSFYNELTIEQVGRIIRAALTNVGGEA